MKMVIIAIGGCLLKQLTFLLTLQVLVGGGFVFCFFSCFLFFVFVFVFVFFLFAFFFCTLQSLYLSSKSVLTEEILWLYVAAEPQPFMVLFFLFFFGGPQGYGFHRIKNLRNCAKNSSHLSTVIFTTKRFVRVESCG